MEARPSIVQLSSALVETSSDAFSILLLLPVRPDSPLTERRAALRNRKLEAQLEAEGVWHQADRHVQIPKHPRHEGVTWCNSARHEGFMAHWSTSWLNSSASVLAVCRVGSPEGRRDVVPLWSLPQCTIHPFRSILTSSGLYPRAKAHFPKPKTNRSLTVFAKL